MDETITRMWDKHEHLRGSSGSRSGTRPRHRGGRVASSPSEGMAEPWRHVWHRDSVRHTGPLETGHHLVSVIEPA
ncbi:hypothetical protein EYF80_032970 [Liparis tanakae]|uniref:Uncharacterized protein n=1 Tax=Liparis tanakae TaxID=230148 RepID=A0A4Z2GVL9_9TELE|nr:hypothetical protein EYF80_032970 [Liparis tanakae]